MPDDDPLDILMHGLRKVGKPTLRKLASEHTPDEARRIAARAILDQVRLSGFDVVRVKPPVKAH